MRILVLSVSGMLGNAMIRVLSGYEGLEGFGMTRSRNVERIFPVRVSKRLMTGIDVENRDELANVFRRVRPHVSYSR